VTFTKIDEEPLSPELCNISCFNELSITWNQYCYQYQNFKYYKIEIKMRIIIALAFVTGLLNTGNTQLATLVKEINPSGSAFADGKTFVSNGTMYFLAKDGVNGSELWRTDGTELGTWLLKDIAPGADGLSAVDFAQLGDQIIMGVAGLSDNYAIWKTDGTTQGTVLIKTLYNGFPGWKDRLVTYNGFVYFTADDGNTGPEVWRTDGTEANTTVLKNIGSAVSHIPERITVWNDKLYFYHKESQHGYELWSSDGTPEGTLIVKDIYPGSSDSKPDPTRFDLVPTDTGLFFTANNGTNGEELWITDGTESGTIMVKDINPTSTTPGAELNGGFPEYQNFAFLNGKLFFRGNDNVNGKELWSTDGTTAGTSMVKNAVQGSAGLNIFQMAVLNGKIFFNASNTNDGSEMWISDGTAAGTKLIKDISFGFGNGVAAFSDVVSYSNQVWFSGNNPFNGEELWKTDGTEVGTLMADDISVGFPGSFPQNLTVLGDKLLFFAIRDGIEDYELFSVFVPFVKVIDLNDDVKLKVSPNPVTTFFSLKTQTPIPDGCKVTAFDMTGRLVQTWEWKQLQQQFDCTALQTGSYYLHISDKDYQIYAATILIKQ
jgi:ELWxxDGT repeat protein